MAKSKPKKRAKDVSKPRPVVRRPASKRTSKRAAATRAPANKAAANKAPAKRAPEKRAPAKRASANKASAKRAPAKRAAANKASAKRARAKRAPATKRPALSRSSTPEQASIKSATARAERAVPAPTPQPIFSDWRGTLRTAIEQTGDDFASYLRGLGASGWEHADSPELAGLEAWGTELTMRDRRAGIGALVRVAQHGIRIAIDAGGIGLEGMGFHASEPSADGAPVEKQIQLAAAWLDAPDAAHLAAVATGNDRSRQLQMWDEDLIPSDDRAHWWYLDVGQCCGHAITRAHGDARKHSYYDWPPETCVGRGLVLAVRGLRCKGADLRALLADVRAAMVACAIRD